MKETGMLFSAPMVRALLDGSKTQTRRIVKQLDPAMGACTTGNDGRPMSVCWAFGGPVLHCPYGQLGDRIWVRETFRLTDTFDLDSPSRVGERCIDAGYKKPWAPIQYEADGQQRDWHHVGTPPHDGTQPKPGKTRVSIHMPRWASRIELEIVSVRVERLNDCSDADARAEGTPGGHGVIPSYHYNATPSEHYAHLWESINGAGSWAANPWVWVIEFKRIPA